METKITELSRELEEISSFSTEEFMEVVKDVGFSCTGCAKCCTREFNDHVFLLDDDAARAKEINPDALVPAPYFEICDQNGEFYVSGYALRSRENGDCIFLSAGRCSIYDRRFSICRVYPYMLHREYAEDGTRDWRQISGLNEHGEYHHEIPEEECRRIAEETIAYEKACLRKEIAFYSFCTRYFREHHLRPVRRMYDMKMRDFEKGEDVVVHVFDGTGFERWVISKQDLLFPDVIG